MQPKHKAIAAAGAVGLAGLVGAVVAAPTLTATALSAASTAATDRVERITNALAGLVEDGTLTQEQVDRVAETLDEQLPAHGPGGFGGHYGIRLGLDAAAEQLGLSGDELRDQLRDGSTLAEIADEQGVDVDALVSALVAAAEEDLAAAVEDGRLEQERADEIAADLEERIRTFVEEGFPAPPDGPRPGGPGPWGGDRADTNPDEVEPDDGSSATPSAV
jgi:hypothetical protein